MAKGDMRLQVEDGSIVNATMLEDYHLILTNCFNLVLNNCYYVKNFICRIISISKLFEAGYGFQCKDRIMNIVSNGNNVCDGVLDNGIYVQNFNRLRCE